LCSSFFKYQYHIYEIKNHNKEADEDIGHDCPIPEGYSVNLTHYNATSWCTATSSTDDMDSAAGLMYHAVDTAMDDGISQRKFNCLQL
jgi:hypothetical protein